MKLNKSRNRGFTLIELLISMAVFLILSGAIVSSMIQVQQDRRRNEIRSDLEDKVRAAAELIVRDVSQAGRMPSLDRPFNSPALPLIASSAAATTVTIGSGSIAGLYVGEVISVDGGLKEEFAIVCSVPSSSSPGSTITVTTASPAFSSPGVCISAPLVLPHTGSNIGIYPVGILAEGILSTTRTGLHSSAQQLFLVGAIESDTLELIMYQCSVNAGQLIRTVWTITNTQGVISTAPTTSAVLLQNATCNFVYPIQASDPTHLMTYPVAAGTAANPNRTVVSYVTFNVKATSSTPEPSTSPGAGNYWSLNKSYMFIQPRNLTAAANLGSQQLQDSPSSGTVMSASSLP